MALDVDDLKIGNNDDGLIIDHFSVNQTVLLSARITNFQNSESSYVIIFDIRDAKGITVYLGIKEGIIGANSIIRSSAQWTPEKTDKYELHSFVVDSFEAPRIITLPRLIQIPIPQNTTLTTIFGCETNGSTPFCSRQASSASAVQLAGNWHRVYTDTTNTPEFVQGKFGKALHLHAYNEDFIEISQNNRTSLDQQYDKQVPIYAQSEFSVSFWIKADPTDTALGQVVSYLNTKKDRGWAFDVQDPTISSIKFEVSNTEGKLVATKGLPIPTDSFTNVIGTFDGSNVRLYSNGTLYDIVNFEGKYGQDGGSQVLKIGTAAYCYSCSSWGGTLDELEVFNRSLTAQEVSSIASSQDMNFQSTEINDAIAGRWSFDSGLLDSSSNNANGVLRTPVVSMAFSPDGTLFFTEKNTGKIKIMRHDKVLEPAFATISDVKKGIMFGLLGIAIDPQFSENHYVYAFYTTTDNDTGQDYSRVVRFTDVDDKGIDKAVILDRLPASNEFDSGGAIAFDPQQRLYVSVGDGIPPYQEDESQRRLSQDPYSLFGKVLRVNRDGSIPKDNPFPGSSVFTLGHKNIFGIAFDRDGFGIVTENGESLYDEINLIESGGNYGWPDLQLPNLDPQLSNSSIAIKPIRSYFKPIAPTEAVYYEGDKFPELKGKFLFGSYNRGMLYAIGLDPNKRQVVSEEIIRFPNPGTMPIISVAASPSGDIYVGAHDIYKLDSIDSSPGHARQVLYPVGVITPSNISTDTMYYDSVGQIISLEISAMAEGSDDKMLDNQEKNAGAAISIIMPSSLMRGIGSVSLSNLSAPGSSSDPTNIGAPLHFSIDKLAREAQNSTKADSDSGANNMSWWFEENTLVLRIEDEIPAGKWRIEIDGSGK